MSSEKKAFKDKANKVMLGPASEFHKLWKLMEESEAGTMQLKLYREEGDEKPFRAIVLINGEEEVEEILKYLDNREQD